MRDVRLAGLRQRGGGVVEVDAGEPVKPDELDQAQDLRLGRVKAQRTAARPQAPGESRQVEHQRGVGERERGEIDDDVVLSSDRERQCPSTRALRGAIFVAPAAQDSGAFIELDDRGKVLDPGPARKGKWPSFLHLHDA